MQNILILIMIATSIPIYSLPILRPIVISTVRLKNDIPELVKQTLEACRSLSLRDRWNMGITTCRKISFISKNKPSSSVHIAAVDENKNSIGYARINSDKCFLESFFIAAHAQGKGTGSAFLEQVINDHLSHCKTIYLNVTFYERNGFKVTSSNKYIHEMERKKI